MKMLSDRAIFRRIGDNRPWDNTWVGEKKLFVRLTILCIFLLMFIRSIFSDYSAPIDFVFPHNSMQASENSSEAPAVKISGNDRIIQNPFGLNDFLYSDGSLSVANSITSTVICHDPDKIKRISKRKIKTSKKNKLTKSVKKFSKTKKLHNKSFKFKQVKRETMKAKYLSIIKQQNKFNIQKKYKKILVKIKKNNSIKLNAYKKPMQINTIKTYLNPMQINTIKTYLKPMKFDTIKTDLKPKTFLQKVKAKIKSVIDFVPRIFESINKIKNAFINSIKSVFSKPNIKRKRNVFSIGLPILKTDKYGNEFYRIYKTQLEKKQINARKITKNYLKKLFFGMNNTQVSDFKKATSIYKSVILTDKLFYGTFIQRKIASMHTKIIHAYFANLPGFCLTSAFIISVFRTTSRKYIDKLSIFKKDMLCEKYLICCGVAEAYLLSEKLFDDYKNRTLSFNDSKTKNIRSGGVTGYIKQKLSRYFKADELMSPLIFILRQIKKLKGFLVNIKGRLTRQERAAFLLKRSGSIPFSDVKKLIDYCKDFKPMRFGMSGFRSWLYRLLDYLAEKFGYSTITTFLLPVIKIKEYTFRDSSESHEYSSIVRKHNGSAITNEEKYNKFVEKANFESQFLNSIEPVITGRPMRFGISRFRNCMPKLKKYTLKVLPWVMWSPHNRLTTHPKNHDFRIYENRPNLSPEEKKILSEIVSSKIKVLQHGVYADEYKREVLLKTQSKLESRNPGDIREREKFGFSKNPHIAGAQIEDELDKVDINEKTVAIQRKSALKALNSYQDGYNKTIEDANKDLLNTDLDFRADPVSLDFVNERIAEADIKLKRTLLKLNDFKIQRRTEAKRQWVEQKQIIESAIEEKREKTQIELKAAIKRELQATIERELQAIKEKKEEEEAKSQAYHKMQKKINDGKLLEPKSKLQQNAELKSKPEQNVQPEKTPIITESEENEAVSQSKDQFDSLIELLNDSKNDLGIVILIFSAALLIIFLYERFFGKTKK